MNQKSSSSSDSNSNNSKFGNKFSLNKFLKSKKGQYSLFSLLTLSVLLISGLFTFSLLQNTDTALAALNCPAGSSSNGSQCISNTPSSYTCPAGYPFNNNNGTCGRDVLLKKYLVLKTYGNVLPSANDPCVVAVDPRLIYMSETPESAFDSARNCATTISFDVTSAAFLQVNSYNYILPGANEPCAMVLDSRVTYLTNGNAPASGGCASTVLDLSQNYIVFKSYNIINQGANEPCAAVPTPSIMYVSSAPENFMNGCGGGQGGNSVSVNLKEFTRINDGTATPVYGTAVTPTSYTVEDVNVSTGTCTSNLGTNTVVIGQTMNCTFPLTGSPAGVPYILPPEGLYAGLWDTPTNSNSFLGNSGLCTISANSMTCNNVPTTGGTPGPAELVIHRPGVAWYPNKGSIELVASSSPLTTADIPSLTVTCGVGGTPGTVRVNTTTTCTFTLPTNKTLPNNFKLGIGNATPAGTCTVGANNLVTCINVPTGTLLGTQPINGQIGTETITPTGETVNVIDSLCSTTNPCALFETALTYSPTQALAKRYGASGSTNSDNLILTLKDTRLEQSGFTTTCSIKYKFRTDTSYRILTTNSTYNNTTGCTGNLLKANQLLFNVDFEITAITTNTTTNTTKNYLIYSNYDFKAGSIGVTSIGGSGL